ncbi:unnamed protein product [Schistosoma turkestanicum]|nr:unnamed protein product [Schistosoma turkestanicum]
MVLNRNRVHANMVDKNPNLSLNPNSFRPLTPVQLTQNEMNSNWGRLCGVIRYIKQTHGLKGFYKGCLISLCTFVPSSALWWSFYDKFCGLIYFISKKMWKEPVQDSVLLAPNDAPFPRLLIQLISAPLAGISSAIIVNPIDVVRVRMQSTNNVYSNEG